MNKKNGGPWPPLPVGQLSMSGLRAAQRLDLGEAEAVGRQ